MRALPQIDIQPAPVQADAPARATSRESGNFAETLQRSTDAKSTKTTKSSAGEREAERPTEPAAKVDRSEKSAAKKPADAESEAPTKPSTDTSDTATNDTLPASDDGSVAPEIAALLTAPQLPAIAPLNTAAATLTDFDPLAANATPVDEAALTDLALAANSATVVNPAVQAAPTTLLTAPATGPQITAAASTTAKTTTLPAINAALATGPTVDAAPTADATLVASTTPVVPVATPQPANKTGDTQLSVTSAVTTATTEVDASSVLPPVVAGENTTQVNLPPSAAAPADDNAASAAPLPSAAPITTATPATQSAGMHAVAAAIGKHENKSSAAAETSTVAAKSTNDLATPATPQQPSAPLTPTRPMSETVLAQNALAQQGNAMEKAVSHQITKTLVQQLPNGDRMMALRLTPPELGTVKIEVIERQGVLSAHLHAEDDGVRLALERFLPSMRQDLRASDAPIRELTLSDQAQFQRSFADGQQGQQQQDANRSGNRRGRDDAPRFSIDGVRSEPALAPRAAPLGGRVSLSGVDALA